MYIRPILSVLVSSFSFSFLYLLMFYPIPSGNKDLINITIGMIIGSGFGSVLTYYFGSSDGSKEKTKILDDVISDKNKQLEESFDNTDVNKKEDING